MLTTEQLNLLESLNLQQYVEDATQQAGHILDLVISNSMDEIPFIKNVNNMHQCGISDHHCVLFKLKAKKSMPLRNTVQYRETKSIEMSDFKQDIEISELVDKVVEISTASEKVDTFN